MLSPGIRQVAHALLTRPPLKHISLRFNVFPFDLHVLGTPPAFILSQDQTLMFNLVLLLSNVFRHRNYSAFQVFVLWIFSFSYLEFSGLHYCLFVNVQAAAFNNISDSFNILARLSILCQAHIKKISKNIFQYRFLTLNSLWVSRLWSFLAISSRLSYNFLPRASPISIFAFPPEKYTCRGTRV